MNTMITTRCNRNCSFCFAGVEQHSDMSIVDVQQVLDFHKASGITEFRVLGGEPTQHPYFVMIVQMAVSQGFSIYLMTNGIMDSNIVEFLAQLPSLRIMCNVSPQATDSAKAIAQRTYAFEKLGSRMFLSVTATQPIVDHLSLLTLIQQYSMVKVVRIGIAQPCGTKENTYLHPNNYSMFGKVLQGVAVALNAHGIDVSSDCGLVMCMRPDTATMDEFKPMVYCDPVLDISTELQVFRCFPLFGHISFALTDFNNATELIRAFDEAYAPIATRGCKDECINCTDAEQCTKGCIGHKI